MSTAKAPQESSSGLEAYSVSRIMDNFLQWKNSSDKSRSYAVYHPSAFGKCLRKMQFQRYSSLGVIEQPEKSFDARTIRIFDTGHTMHHRWSEYMRSLKVLRGIWKCQSCGHLHGKEEVLGCFEPQGCADCGSPLLVYEEITVQDKDINFYGHVDQVIDFGSIREDFISSKHGQAVVGDLSNLPSGPFVVDMKSIGKSQWSRIANEPHFEYVVQLTTYIHILGLECGMLIYEKKDDSELRFFRIPRNEQMWEDIKKQAGLMLQMSERKSLPPPRPKSKDSWECKMCEYKDMCHAAGIWNRVDLDDLRRKFYPFDKE